MRCGALILAAGASTRLGQPKQLVILRDETLLERAVRIARQAGCHPVVVVLGAFEDLIRKQCGLQDVLIVSNMKWAGGMGTSLSHGVRALTEIPGVVVLTCDMPAVTADHLRLLASSSEVTASVYAGKKGVPAYFPSEFFPALTALDGEIGARELLNSAFGIELQDGELDIDTAEDLVNLSRMNGHDLI